MKTLTVFLTLPPGTEEVDAEVLRQSVLTVEANDIAAETVPALLLAVAEAVKVEQIIPVADGEYRGISTDARDALIAASARLSLVDEVMHLPSTTIGTTNLLL